MLLFKVLDGRKSCHGGDSTWKLKRWMPKIDEVVPCKSGYHLCRPQDLIYWLGKDIYRAEGRGEAVLSNNKIVFPEARIVSRIEAWDEKSARLFVCWCIRQVWHLLTDERSKNVVVVAEKFANGEATKEELIAAESAAESAARDAARSAARDAARSAARDAARSASWSASWIAARDAVESASWIAARDAARSAVESAQTKKLMEILGAESL